MLVTRRRQIGISVANLRRAYSANKINITSQSRTRCAADRFSATREANKTSICKRATRDRQCHRLHHLYTTPALSVTRQKYCKKSLSTCNVAAHPTGFSPIEIIVIRLMASIDDTISRTRTTRPHSHALSRYTNICNATPAIPSGISDVSKLSSRRGLRQIPRPRAPAARLYCCQLTPSVPRICILNCPADGASQACRQTSGSAGMPARRRALLVNRTDRQPWRLRGGECAVARRAHRRRLRPPSPQRPGHGRADIAVIARDLIEATLIPHKNDRAGASFHYRLEQVFVSGGHGVGVVLLTRSRAPA